MNKAIVRNLALSGNLDSIFDNHKINIKKSDALPTLEFGFIIMSIDPQDTSEDPLQKYCQHGYGKTKELAQKDAESKFKAEYGNLPIYWIK